MFSFTNVPVPTLTPLGHLISGDFKYRVIGYNADTKLEEVAQMYAHRKPDVEIYKETLKAKYAFVVAQEWDKETNSYKSNQRRSEMDASFYLAR